MAPQNGAKIHHMSTFAAKMGARGGTADRINFPHLLTQISTAFSKAFKPSVEQFWKRFWFAFGCQFHGFSERAILVKFCTPPKRKLKFRRSEAMKCNATWSYFSLCAFGRILGPTCLDLEPVLASVLGCMARQIDMEIQAKLEFWAHHFVFMSWTCD